MNTIFSLKNIQPIIKWSGSKRSQGNFIVSQFPGNIDTYYEPFVGSGSILMKLIQAVILNLISVKKFICSDINEDLINCWNLIKLNPSFILSSYTEFYNEFSVLDIDRKKQFYNKVKFLFNESKLSGIYTDEMTAQFFWMRRTAFNGLVRYNSKGEFNAPCHFTRNGIEPDKLSSLLEYWSEKLNKFDVQFIYQSYSSCVPESDNDFFYLDPPYADTASMYSNSNSFDHKQFFEWCSTLNRFILSYNGDRTNADNEKKEYSFSVPKDIYDKQLFLNSGISSFNKFNNLGDVQVRESLFLKNV